MPIPLSQTRASKSLAYSDQAYPVTGSVEDRDLILRSYYVRRFAHMQRPASRVVLRDWLHGSARGRTDGTTLACTVHNDNLIGKTQHTDPVLIDKNVDIVPY